MASEINYASINENFPVAGQDNDTQVFRDNFDTIKNSLATAKNEVSDLLENTARIDSDNDFQNNRIVNATFRAVKSVKWAPANPINSEGSTTELNYENGVYQIYRFGVDSNITFTGLPTNSYAKMILELYSDGSSKVLSFVSTGGTVLKKNSSAGWGGTSSVPTVTVTSSINPVIIEVWQHDSNKIFLNLLGQFS
jgi:hypothetical protein